MLFDIVSLVCDSYQAEVFLERGFRQEVLLDLMLVEHNTMGLILSLE